MPRKNILITGGTGFLGSHLCRRSVETGYRVRVLCRATPSLAQLQSLAVEPVVGDITDPQSVKAAVAGQDCVIHAAADLNYWRANPRRQFVTNVEGTRNIARAAHEAGVCRFLHVSSVAAIGIPTGPAPADEGFRFNLENSGLDYHLSKKQAEEVVFEEISRGLNGVIVNPASISGPTRLSSLLSNINRCHIVPCFSGGNCVVHVEDVVSGVFLALEHGRTGERYILGGDNLTFRHQAELAATALGKPRRFITIPPVITRVSAALLEPMARVREKRPRIAYLTHYCANRFQFYSSEKAASEFGYAARTFNAILHEGLQLLGGAISPTVLGVNPFSVTKSNEAERLN